MEQLFHIWLNSYGGNAALNLNVPPDRTGRIDERDMERLREFGNFIENEFKEAHKVEIQKAEGTPPTQPVYQIYLSDDAADLKYVVLRENLAKGQRVESFQITADFYNGGRYPLYEGTCIGNRKICVLQDSFANRNPLPDQDLDCKISHLTLQITAARGVVELQEISVYGENKHRLSKDG